MEITDPIHGLIHILDQEIPVISHPFFQRLRNIKQLGLAEYIFPGATHSRFLHSLGVMHIGDKIFEKVFFGSFKEEKVKVLKKTFRLACLLHDLGHPPLSHTTEIAMPMLEELELLPEFSQEKSRQANHEDYSIKILTQSSFKKSFEQLEKLGVMPNRVAELIRGKTSDSSYYTIEGINYFPFFTQLISSELDCDRMDYLLRDSYFCGVSYGHFNMDWIIDSIETCIIDNQAYLGINERSLVSFEDFLIGRYHMFVMVYFHYKNTCLDKLLYQFLNQEPKAYTIPSDIEEYVQHNDYYLMKILKASKNEYAQALLKNQIPPKIFESFNQEQLKQLKKIEAFLKENHIKYIRTSSKGKLSQYYNEKKANYSVKVLRKVSTKKNIITELEKVTPLFSRYSQDLAIDRIHCNTNQLSQSQKDQLESLL